MRKNFLSILLFPLCLFSQTEKVKENYMFIRQELNKIQFFDRSAVSTLHQKWIHTETKRFSFIHMGDSHIQPDIFPSEVRKRLQENKGKGGQGLIFPFSIAKTYSSVEYSSSHKGIWKASRSIEYAPKLTLGVQGATARTEDSGASFSIHFKVAVPDNYRVLKIFTKRTKDCFDFSVEAGGKKEFVYSEPPYGIEQGYIELRFPATVTSITIKMIKRNAFQQEFEFYGMSLESTSQEGLLYHCAGIGGARFNAILHQKLLVRQMKELDPDLVALDYGTNDFLYDDIIKPELYAEICASIDSVRKAAPRACIVLTSTHDMFYHKRNVHSSITFAEMIRKIAQQKKCAFYDWFRISGGPGSMKWWVENNIAQKDFVHLNTAGYRLKGKMFSDAFLELIHYLSKNENADSFVMPSDTFLIPQDTLLPDSLFIKKNQVSPSKSSENRTIKHKVLKGQNLGVIARKYKVAVSDLKKWNKLKSEKIMEGQQLIVQMRN